ncbi:MAG: transglycosylase SLT domain-containing protein [Terracidiphilus sp.]|nr:transglycosylase SLT domain-containing protein [Terracidiphilus sp.]
MSKVFYRSAVCTALALALAGCTPTDQGKSPQSASPRSTAPALPAAATQPAPVVQKQAIRTPQQQRVEALIGQVEKAYADGQADYKKGDLVAAKAEFDHAVDLMLTSGIDIKTEPQLQDEFDHVVDGINGLEMEALKIGNGFVPKEEPTPAEAASDATFVVDPKVLAAARANLATTKSDLPLVVNDYVAVYINFFANTKKGHYTLLHSMQRSGRYRSMIQRVMAEEGVPQDLIYLAVAESGFNPRAIGPRTRSGGRAGGMWQFMPNDKFYGLARTQYVDERFDPEKSTRAYARYMKYIYNQLGDWYLSMAAYNWGTGSVQRAVEKTGYADFWELYRRNNLPVETKNYVPEIIAAIIIANHPEQYGFDDLSLDPPVLTDTVTINYSVDLRLVADIVDAPVDEIVALNPSLLRMITPSDGPFDLHLPAGSALNFERRIAQVPEPHRDAWRYHRVQPDDTLASVARTFHVDVDNLASVNQLRTDEKLDGVEALVVPAAPAVERSARSSSGMYYTTRRGDTLVSVADRFGVSLAQLRSWNNLSGVKVGSGRRLRIAAPTLTTHTRSSSKTRGSAKSANTSDDDSSSSAKSKSRKSSHKGQAAKAAPDAEKSSSGKSGAKTAARSKSKSAAQSDAKPTLHKKSRSRAHQSR